MNFLQRLLAIQRNDPAMFNNIVRANQNRNERNQDVARETGRAVFVPAFRRSTRSATGRFVGRLANGDPIYLQSDGTSLADRSGNIIGLRRHGGTPPRILNHQDD